MNARIVAGMIAVQAASLAAQQPAQAPRWVVPPGFQVDVFADNVPNARDMALGARGTVFVGSMQAGKVHAVVDRDGDHKADRVVLIASGLDMPNGVAFRNGALYVATTNRILRYDDIEAHLDSPPAPVVVRDNLPNPKEGHTWKFIAFGPDNLLYMSVGAPCNICESPPMVSAILRMKPDGSNLEVFAEGVRNSVGFDWHPVTHELWFTDNGRDQMGDDVPNDELNVAWKKGLHFGFPYCHQGDVADPRFGARRACSTTEPPAQKLGAHVAAIGFTFYTGSMFPASYRNAAIIAQHGSWNRSSPSGYRVMVARTDGRRVTSYEPLLEGFLPEPRSSVPGGWAAGQAALGRPADVRQLPDGSILVSDDKANRLLRISYRGRRGASSGASDAASRGESRAEIVPSDTGVMSENLTSSRDGTVYFGSMAKANIYRALPGAARAEPWIVGTTAGLSRVLGVLADDESNTLWVCQNATDGRDGRPVTGTTALRTFNLRTGVAKGTYPFPANAGVCNDIAVSSNGTAYVSESFRGRIHRLRPGATRLDVWVSDSTLDVIDGIAVLADGAVYANNFTSGKLFRVPVNADGSAGAVTPIETSIPFVRPDGLRSTGQRTLLQAEGQGRVTEITLDGNRADVRVLRDGLTRATGVTLVGDTVFALVELARAVAIPYRALSTASATKTPEQELVDLSREKWRWMAEKKADTLAALFDDKAVFVHMGGSWGKNREVEIIRSGGIHYKHAEIFESSARIIGSTGIVLSRIRLDAVVGGNAVSNPFIVTEVYVRQNDAWKLASLSFTRLLGQ